jgi:hypothetical protein
MAAEGATKSLGRIPSIKTEISVGVLATVVLLGAVGLIVWQLVNHANPDATTVGAFLMAVAATLAIAFPKSFISLGRRISHVNAFGITLELQVEEAKKVIAQFENKEDEVEVKPPSWPAGNRRAMAMVADKLRKRLRFASEAVLGARKGVPEELIVANLGNECLLPLDEVTLCRDLLGDFYKRLDELDSEERKGFLDSSWEFAARFGTRVFDRQVRRDLTENGWKIGSFDQGKRHRPDFVAVRAGVSALIAARVASPRRTLLEKTGPRLSKKEDPPLPDLRRLIVVPDHVDGLWDEIEDGPMGLGPKVLVVRLGQLLEDPALANRDPSELPQIPPEDDDGQ